jgi:hypothetical protein
MRGFQLSIVTPLKNAENVVYVRRSTLMWNAGENLSYSTWRKDYQGPEAVHGAQHPRILMGNHFNSRLQMSLLTIYFRLQVAYEGLDSALYVVEQ